MRRAAKVDANQPDIVAALRAVGCSVQPLHTVGQGCPDLLVANPRGMYLIEVKDGTRPPSDRKLTDDQIEWIAKWRGPVHLVTSVDDALAVVR